MEATDLVHDGTKGFVTEINLVCLRFMSSLTRNTPARRSRRENASAQKKQIEPWPSGIQVMPGQYDTDPPVT